MNLESFRADFPLLSSAKPPIYLDNACMTLKPRQIVDAMNRYYLEFPACGERSQHKLGKKVTDEVNKARENVRRFINARKAEEIIFTKNTTEGLNTVLSGLDWKKGDFVLSSDREHNSNLLPIQRLRERGVMHLVVRSLKDGSLDLDAFDAALQGGVKLVSIVHTSNLDGYVMPVREIVKRAHKSGAMVLLDCAQAAPHQELDVRGLDADFAAFSGHKMLGPSIGVLYGKEEQLKKLRPLTVGGGTVDSSTYETSEPSPLPERLEAGLQNYAGIIGLSAAMDYLKKVGLFKVEKHERELNSQLQEGISGIKGLHVIGPAPDKRCGVTSFYVDKVDHHQIAMLLDSTANIMVRSGQHCVHSWFAHHKIAGSVRASMYLYNTSEEIIQFNKSFQQLIKSLRG